MKKLYFLLITLCFFTDVNAQIINFSDINFKMKLLASDPTNNIAINLSDEQFKVDANSDGEIEI